jgi:hypothetical protein
MKSIRYTIWILLAFVVTATLDSQPDPPAVNPGSSLCKVLHHDASSDTATQRFDCLNAPSSFPVPRNAADAWEPYRPTDRMILTVHAADPSPPTVPALRKLCFQS